MPATLTSALAAAIPHPNFGKDSRPVKLVQVKAPHFTAGFVTDGTSVIEAAPILKYLIGKTEAYARHYLKQKGWSTNVVSSTDQ
jgi:hypothetical protein